MRTETRFHFIGEEVQLQLHYCARFSVRTGQLYSWTNFDTRMDGIFKLLLPHIQPGELQLARWLVSTLRLIEKCLEYFLERGHEVKVYIAASMMEKREVSEHNRKKLRKLYNEGKLVLVLSRKPSFQSYDCYEEYFIIQNAIKTQGIIVSNDYFLDLIAKSPDYREQIEKRLLPFNFIDGELWLPSDPLGKNQGSLETTWLRPPQT